tara:strand:- start:2880 stop:3089 length:210 start_codon:yes stop_codon:yes gene_type:complete
MNVKITDQENSKNQKERFTFVEKWAEYVRTHSDEEWSKQQNFLINSLLKSANQMSRKEYLGLKGERFIE